MQTLEEFLQQYHLRRALIVFISVQLIGSGLALGLAKSAPGLTAIPGIGIEILRGIPALLIIFVVWLELVAKKINATQSLVQIFQRITRVDIAAIALFNLAFGICSIVAILLVIQLLSPGSLTETLEPKQLSLFALLTGAATSTILAPISEEIVFRGWLFNALKRRLNPWPAIISSSLVFAAIHPPLSFVTTFLFGTCAAIVYFKTSNLWASILVHALNNMLISTQSVTEHILIQAGLVNDSNNPMQMAFMLGIPSILATLWLGHYLVIKKRFFNLLVSLSP
jgi:membrane protease YdiL (CAAX protease family)